MHYEAVEELKLRKPEDFIVGQIYYIQSDIDSKRFLITLCEGIEDNDRIKGRYLTNFDGKFMFAPKTTTPYVTGRPSRLANYEEIKWYTECVRANRYIPQEEISKRVVPTEKSFAITETQLFMLHDIGNPIIKDMLEKWYTTEMFFPKVGGNS